jgi:hypothetical protein
MYHDLHTVGLEHSPTVACQLPESSDVMSRVIRLRMKMASTSMLTLPSSDENLSVVLFRLLRTPIPSAYAVSRHSLPDATLAHPTTRAPHDLGVGADVQDHAKDKGRVAEHGAL